MLRTPGTTARLALIVLACGLIAGPAARAEEGTEPAESESELAKKTQNPVADLISVPFQNNLSFGIGPRNAVQWVLNVQPVVPFHLTENWNLITRTIMPIISQGSPAPGIDHVAGLGDINPTFFLAPSLRSDGRRGGRAPDEIGADPPLWGLSLKVSADSIRDVPEVTGPT